MTQLLKAVVLMAALVAAPALAQTADQHAAHHPKAPAATAATPDPKAADVTGCPGVNSQAMGGQMMGGQTAGGQAMADHMKDHMAGGQMGGSASGQGMGSGTMMGGAAAGEGMAGGQMMGGAAGGQGMGPGAVTAQNPHCNPYGAKTPPAPTK